MNDTAGDRTIGSGFRRILSRAAIAFSLSTICSSAFAQNAAPTREELRLLDKLEQQPAPRTSLTVDGGIERGPCPLADPALAATTVTFSSVEFVNLAAVEPSVLGPAWRDLAGAAVPVSSLCEVRDRAATLLRRMGFLAAVQIPPQRIEAGAQVRMDVLIARLVEVQVRGEPGRTEGLIAAHLVKLTEGEWFNIGQAERHLLLLGDLPGYDVRLTLRPAKGAPGDVVGDVLVEHTPVEVVVGLQNLGSKATGRYGALAQVVLNGLTGMGDRTALSLFNTVEPDEQTVLQLSHGMALGSDGLRIEGSVLYGRGEPDVGTGNLETETILGKLELFYPIKRAQSQSAFIAGGVDIVSQSVDLGALPISEDDLRIVYGRFSFDTFDAGSLGRRAGYSPSEPKWRFAGFVEARHGIGGLGASDDCAPITNCTAPNVPISNLFADPSAFVVRGQAQIEFRPTPMIALTASPRIQYTDDALVSFEQFSLGNYTIGRGLDPGIVLGDRGIGSTFELRYGKLLTGSPDSVAFQPFVFLDAAWAWSNDGGLTNDPRKVFSAGGGVRARLGNRLDANLVVAAPLRRAGLQSRAGDVRVLFNIRARLVPWR